MSVLYRVCALIFTSICVATPFPGQRDGAAIRKRGSLGRAQQFWWLEYQSWSSLRRSCFLSLVHVEGPSATAQV